MNRLTILKGGWITPQKAHVGSSNPKTTAKSTFASFVLYLKIQGDFALDGPMQQAFFLLHLFFTEYGKELIF